MSDEILSRLTDSQPPRIVCAWCSDFDPKLSKTMTSHGMCAECHKKIMQQLDRRAAEKISKGEL